MKKKKKLLLIVGAVLVALLVVINLKSKGGGDTQVSIEKAQKRDLVEKVSATGEIKPKKNINISTDVAGKILKVLVKEGDLVKPGQLLLKVDAAYYEANAERDREVINSSRAELLSQGVQVKKAKQYFLRRQQLFEQGMISKELFEDAQAQLDVAQASQQAIEHQIKQAQASLSSTNDSIKKTYIVSPIEGIVTSLAVEEGEVAIIGTMNNPGTVLMTIADLSVMEAEVLVDETDVVRV
ncbi:MAG TPA: efflux RND transporter periplasmic adaptor subunit, partial [Candidatus Aminicenantes bacterium]|nr:efflux RND transporter periplasmic adaptor subunit [Candidatus Aminicenantes bacterium]